MHLRNADIRHHTTHHRHHETTWRQKCCFLHFFLKKSHPSISPYRLHTNHFRNELTAMWLSVDPMADKYPSISPYAYCAWNPIKLVDPDGRMIDDYFSKDGKYLGTDNAKTDNIRIIDEGRWNELSENGVINHDVGYDNSESFSSAHPSMDEDAQLNVYQHYNPTKYELFATSSKRSPKKPGMITITKNKKSRIGIYLKENFEGIIIADHANEIINSFVHEDRHAKDHKRNPNLTESEYEDSALEAQFYHNSWNGCRPQFRHAITDYARKKSTLSSSIIDLFDPYSDLWKQ